uniref:DUF4219 domain-containing protein n=1 Tax=Amphimedon queenslandica TaxID=400682 RepID=A0A1X7UPX5_AMPQE
MAATNHKLFSNIPQLNTEKDWPVWTFQVTHALKAADQWEFVTGRADHTRQNYKSKKQKAFYSILQCIRQKNIPAVIKKTVSNKLYALMQMYGLHMKRGASIQDHLRQLDELADHLAALNIAVSELDKVAVLLRSVHESYPTLVTALLARGDEELTLLFVKQALLDEEQR